MVTPEVVVRIFEEVWVAALAVGETVVIVIPEPVVLTFAVAVVGVEVGRPEGGVAIGDVGVCLADVVDDPEFVVASCRVFELGV